MKDKNTHIFKYLATPDTVAEVCIAREDFLSKSQLNCQDLFKSKYKLESATGLPLELLGYINM